MSKLIDSLPPVEPTYQVEFTEREMAHLCSLLGRHGGHVHDGFDNESSELNDSTFEAFADWRNSKRSLITHRQL